MFITEKMVSTEFGFGVRYVIFLTDEEDEKGYEVSVSSIISDVKKYPWLTGITIAGKEPFNRQDVCMQIFKDLPSYMNMMIITKEEYEDIDKTELYKAFPAILPLRESDLDYFIKKYINNKDEEEV